MKAILSIILFFLSNPANAAVYAPPTPAMIRHELEILQTQYRKLLGSYKNSGWWNDAHNLEAILNASRYVGVDDYNGVVGHSYGLLRFRPWGNFINNIYDDESWWGITWVRAYQVTGNLKYLIRATRIHKQIANHAWTNTCGGGLNWKFLRKYKNSITNGVFLELSSLLAEVSFGDERKYYLDWAYKVFDWVLQSGMLDKGTGLFADGTLSDCSSNHQLDWTFIQGVYIGAAATLFHLDGKQRWLDLGKSFIQGAWDHQTENGILFEKSCHDSYTATPWTPWVPGFVGQPSCMPDAVLYKGIFMKNLALFYENLPAHDPFKQKIENFTRDQVAAIESGPRDDFGFVGLNWGEKSVIYSTSSETSGIEGLISGYRILVRNKN